MISVKEIFSFSDAGVRENQEDYIIVPRNGENRVFVVCDGMGGHGHGEVASKTVAESVYASLADNHIGEYTPSDIRNAVEKALESLHEADTFGDADEKRMGTTLVVAVVNRMNVLVGHVGDSRCYLFGDDASIKFRSRDHSRVQEAVEAEILTEEEAWSSPNKNILTRCILSTTEKVDVEIDSIEVDEGDILMLCTDGVNDAMRDREIRAMFVGRGLGEASDMICQNCSAHSRDNFSAIFLSLGQDEKPKKSAGVNEDVEIAEPPAFGGGNAFSQDNVLTPPAFPQVPPYEGLPKKMSVTYRLREVNPFILAAAGFFLGVIFTLLVVSQRKDTSDDKPKKETHLVVKDKVTKVTKNSKGTIDIKDKKESKH